MIYRIHKYLLKDLIESGAEYGENAFLTFIYLKINGLMVVL